MSTSHIELSKNRNDKSGSGAACVYQVIKIKTSTKFSEIEFLGLL